MNTATCKKIRSKASLFVLVLALIINSTSVFAGTNDKSFTINGIELQYDTIIYLNATTGDDTTGDGTEANPFKTLAKAITAYNGYTAYVMASGTYESVSINSRTYDPGIAFIGNGKDTIFKVNTSITVPESNATTNLLHGKVSFYNFVWDAQSISTDNYNIFYYAEVTLNNIVFVNAASSQYGYFTIVGEATAFFNNCVLADVPIRANFIRGVKMINCYGPFSAYNNAIDESDYKTNIITEQGTMNLDAAYKITSGEWENTGTGMNPDGTVANIGVYGGPFAWDANGNTNDGTVNTSPTLEIVAEKEEVRTGETFYVDAKLHNVSNIYAEDFVVDYDQTRFEYVGYENVTGLKVYQEDHEMATGEIRYIVASQGEEYAINDGDVVVRLKFKAIAIGDGKVDATKGRIADTTIESDILAENCGEDTITVIQVMDVNRTGEFTLLDLAIDGFYFGKNASDTDLTKYDADVVVDSSIDDADLTAIVANILSNSNYAPNN